MGSWGKEKFQLCDVCVVYYIIITVVLKCDLFQILNLIKIYLFNKRNFIFVNKILL